jgi:hypothetical protein
MRRRSSDINTKKIKFDKSPYFEVQNPLTVDDFKKIDNLEGEIVSHRMHFEEFMKKNCEYNRVNVFNYFLYNFSKYLTKIAFEPHTLTYYIKKHLNSEDNLRFFISSSLPNFVETYVASGLEVYEDALKEATTINNINGTDESFEILLIIENVLKYPRHNFFKRKEEFCNSKENMFDYPIVSAKYKIIIPYKEIIPLDFKVDFLVNVKDTLTIYTTVDLESTNHFHGLNSINDNNFNLDVDWIQECNRYIMNLPIKDKFTIYGYTHKGDEISHSYLLNKDLDISSTIKSSGNKYFCYYFQTIEVIKQLEGNMSNYLKRNIDNELKYIIGEDILKSYNTLNKDTTLQTFTNDFWILVVNKFIKDLKRIIQNSPAIKKESHVYRGVKTKYYTINNKSTFHSLTFMSTSFDPMVAKKFASDGYCCMKKIILPPGTRAILPMFLTQHSLEKEILLNIDSEFEFVDHSISLFSDRIPMKITEKMLEKKTVCDTPYNKSNMITTMKLII